MACATAQRSLYAHNTLYTSHERELGQVHIPPHRQHLHLCARSSYLYRYELFDGISVLYLSTRYATNRNIVAVSPGSKRNLFILNSRCISNRFNLILCFR